MASGMMLWRMAIDGRHLWHMWKRCRHLHWQCTYAAVLTWQTADSQVLMATTVAVQLQYGVLAPPNMYLAAAAASCGALLTS